MKPITPTFEQLSSPIWRICNLYTIQSRVATGPGSGPIAFRPTPEQMEILEDIYIRGLEFLIIPKSRQLGMSTVIAIIILDSILFGSGVQCSIVDATIPDATKKLNGKIKYAFEALDPAFRAGWEIVKSNESEFVIKRTGTDKSDESMVSASMSARGGTNHILHISEWGEVQLKDKRRSLEILTGALPTAAHPGCLTIIESTWKGGKTGELWGLVAEALKVQEADKGPKDARIRFYGWWTNPNNSDDGSPALITPETHEYCDKAERLISRRLSNGQRLWWQKQKAKFGIHMLSEHPTTMEECFEAPHEGAYFDAEGLKWQETQIVPMETRTQYGDIAVQSGRAAFWIPKPKDRALYRIWEAPQEGDAYLISADFCVGKQAVGSTGERDSNAWSVWRAGRLDPVTKEYRMPMKVAATLPNDRCGTVETIRRIHGLYKLYGECIVVPEVNNKDNICGQMQAAGITNIWSQTQTGADGTKAGTGKREEVFGWLTNEGTRRQALESMRDMIEQQAFICSCPVALHQYNVFVINKHGKAEAAAGEHDDWVMSDAIGLYCLPAATPYVSPGQRSLLVGRAGFDPSHGVVDGRGL